VAELQRAFDELGAYGVVLTTNLAGKYVDEPEFKPFWNELARRGKPLSSTPPTRPVWVTGTSTRSASAPTIPTVVAAAKTIR
jgi:predicted TIM-barrel fold metal-dependent hydrolase